MILTKTLCMYLNTTDKSTQTLFKTSKGLVNVHAYVIIKMNRMFLRVHYKLQVIRKIELQCIV